MAWLRHCCPSQVIGGLPFYQVTGKLVTKHKKMPRDGNSVLGRNVDWGILSLHHENTEKKIPEDATASRINIIQAMQTN